LRTLSARVSLNPAEVEKSNQGQQPHRAQLTPAADKPSDLLGFSEQRCCLGFTDVVQGRYFFTLEDVFTEGALEQDREAAGAFRLISGGRDREAIDGENLGST